MDSIFFNQHRTGRYSFFNCAPTIIAYLNGYDKKYVRKIRSVGPSSLFFNNNDIINNAYNNNIKATIYSSFKYAYENSIIDIKKYSYIVNVNMRKIRRSGEGRSYRVFWPYWWHYLIISDESRLYFYGYDPYEKKPSLRKWLKSDLLKATRSEGNYLIKGGHNDSN